MPDRPIAEAGCWAHARRKLFELADIAAKVGHQKAISPIAFGRCKTSLPPRARSMGSRLMTVAAPAHAIMISRATEIRGEDEKLLWYLATDMEPEHGRLWIHHIGDQPVPFAPTEWNTCERMLWSTNATDYRRGLERTVTMNRSSRPQ
jgi:hypothetical protein